MPHTLADRLWDSHVVEHRDGEPDLLYIDLHLIHEVTSPQAFDGLKSASRRVRRPELTLAVEDHNVPTAPEPAADPLGEQQIAMLRRNCRKHGIELYSMGNPRQGIVHVTAPQLGLIRPGMSVVCGDSHTSTHGAFGALAFGIGTSDVEHVLATQTLSVPRPPTMLVEFTGIVSPSLDPKDLVLTLISSIGVSGAQGHLVEFRGAAISALSMEGRMTLCNMSIEAGAKAGLIAPDDTTVDYLRNLPFAPTGRDWQSAVDTWAGMRSEEGASFDRTVTLDVSGLGAHVTWGTSPGQATDLDGIVPDPASLPADQRAAAEKALSYMRLAPGTRMRDIAIDTVFVGSCTNGRIEDLRAVARILAGRKVSSGVRMLIVPGSMQVRQQAEAEGLDEIFLAAGAQWRLPGCSICLGMNNDRLSGGQRVASTSNRNFEGRQGPGVRTHLVSASVAAATAVRGRLAEPSDLIGGA